MLEVVGNKAPGILRRCNLVGETTKAINNADLLLRIAKRRFKAALRDSSSGEGVIGNDGRLSWIMDAFTTSDNYPYSRHYPTSGNLVNYMRNSVKAVVDAYDGTTTFYVFDAEDPIVAAYRAIFPTLFRDASAMPAALRKHVRYPELLLELQAAVYGLYHMTDPEVFYNHEDLWTVATEVGMSRTHFSQRFRRTVGESPMRYLGRVRLSRAAGYLTTTNLTVYAIEANGALNPKQRHAMGQMPNWIEFVDLR